MAIDDYVDGALVQVLDVYSLGSDIIKDLRKLFASETEKLVGDLASFYVPKSPEFNRNAELLRIFGATLAEFDQHRRSLMVSRNTDLATLAMRTENELMLGSFGVQLGQHTLTPEFARALVSKTLIEGITIRDQWNRLSNNVRQRVFASVRTSSLRGETLQQAISRLRGSPTRPAILNLPRRQAETLVRTGLMGVLQKTRIAMYEGNADIINGVQVLATLDSRTSDLCKAYSGLRWLRRADGTYKADGHNKQYPGPPPYHYNCRSTLLPIVKTWEELAPASRKKQARLADKRGETVAKMQSSMDGEVPQQLNYESWLKRKGPEFTRKVLGPTKAKMFARGRLKLSDMVDRQGRVFTVAELKRRLGEKS